MKVYIVVESRENTICFATLNKNIAEQICEAFGYLGLGFKELDLVGTEL